MRGLPNVSPATRRRVLDAAGELNYTPHPSAAHLAAGKTGLVTMVVPSITSWYTGQAMAGAEAVVTGSGLELSVMLLPDAAAREAIVSDPSSLALRCDAVILLDLIPDPAHVAPWFPLVVVGSRSHAVDSVFIDNEAGATLAAHHLAALGHTEIAVIAGADVEAASPVTALRLAGFEAALESADVPFDRSCMAYGNFSPLGGHEAMTDLLSSPRRPSAVFALSDEMAIGAMKAVADAGLSVPHDISIVGFDDHDLAFAVGLTTVSQSPADLGARAASLLVERIDGNNPPPRQVVGDTHLVVRSSTTSR